MHCKWILNWGIQLTRPAEIALFPRLEAAALGTECRGSKCLMPQNINRVPPISTLVSTFYRVYQSSCHLQQIVPVHIWTFLDHWSYFGPLRVIRTILGYFGPYRPFWDILAPNNNPPRKGPDGAMKICVVNARNSVSYGYFIVLSNILFSAVSRSSLMINLEWLATSSFEPNLSMSAVEAISSCCMRRKSRDML